MLSATSDAYSVFGGNDQLVQLFFEISQAKVLLNTTITEISKKNQSYFLSTSDSVFGPFDSVVLATPIEFSNIIFNFPMVHVTPRVYHHWIVTIVTAKNLKSSYFGGISTVPDTIFTTDNSTVRFTVVHPLTNTSDGLIVYKFFSNEDISNELPEMFDGLSSTFVHYWPYTFPDLTPGIPYQPIQLEDDNDGNVFYLSGMDSVATAMEASTIAGRNIALRIIGK